MSKKLNLHCFQPEYEKEFVAIKASEVGKTFAFCKICLIDFMISRRGKAEIQKHLRSKDHAWNGKRFFENVDHPDADVIRAEYLYADLCNRRKRPLISSEEDVGMLFQRMFPDSKIAQKFNLNRIKTTAILDEIAFKQLSSNLNITCNCGRQAVVNTVRKENQNKGRQFYSCPELNQEARCNFFLWKDDETTASNAGTSHNSSFSPTSYNTRQSNGASQPSNRNSSDGSIPMCRCPNLAVQRRVTKDNANKGRKFYVCGKQGEESCNFFQWADEDGSSTNSVDPLPSTSFAVPSTSNSRRKHSGNNGGPPAKRKCGICSQTGHNRKNCPSNK